MYVNGNPRSDFTYTIRLRKNKAMMYVSICTNVDRIRFQSVHIISQQTRDIEPMLGQCLVFAGIPFETKHNACMRTQVIRIHIDIAIVK